MENGRHELHQQGRTSCQDKRGNHPGRLDQERDQSAKSHERPEAAEHPAQHCDQRVVTVAGVREYG
jgi:hypothetical protein